MKGILEELPSFFPLDFFQLSLEICHFSKGKKELLLQKPFLLPDTSAFLAEDRFAEVGMGWSEEGIYIDSLVKKPFEESFFPLFTNGDCLELFFDTRAVKKGGGWNRFCHHFLIFPLEESERKSQEIPHFHSEGGHPLCEPSEIVVETEYESRSYRVKVWIPTSCLYGYDPVSFSRLGFTYRWNRYGGEPQHFSVSLGDEHREQNPSLWSQLTLKEPL